ncbi:glc operon protein GlcG [Halenospora varia]|nr:glc operon protein GlcG [Halenospora varia]
MSPPTTTQEQLSLSGARIAIAAAEEKAKAMGLGMNIAIVDASTHLLHFSRMEGAKITSINIALDKAFTAAGHRVGTHTYKEAVWPGGVAFGLGNTNGGRFTTFGGGLPILNARGEVVGGIGASTGTPAQDQEVVQAGKDAVEKVLREGGERIKSKL